MNPIIVDDWVTENVVGAFHEMSPGEALQYALTCSKCDGKGTIYFDRLIAGHNFPDDKPCDRCVDGIPRWAIETAAEAIFSQRITGVKKPAPFGTFKDDEQYRVKAVAVLKSLRDREETE